MTNTFSTLHISSVQLFSQIYNWKPDVYNTTENLPVKMPQYIKSSIGGEQLKPKDVISFCKSNRFFLWSMFQFSLQKNLIWISCEGENPADIENLGGINYFPQRGFPDYYFPYVNVHGYLPPLVAVQFDHPKCK